MEEKETKNDRKFARIPQAIAETVGKIAEKEDRSFSNMAVTLIKEALTARGIEC